VLDETFNKYFSDKFISELANLNDLKDLRQQGNFHLKLYLIDTLIKIIHEERILEDSKKLLKTQEANYER
jgi:hypothetical protein